MEGKEGQIKGLEVKTQRDERYDRRGKFVWEMRSEWAAEEEKEEEEEEEEEGGVLSSSAVPHVCCLWAGTDSYLRQPPSGPH